MNGTYSKNTTASAQSSLPESSQAETSMKSNNMDSKGDDLREIHYDHVNSDVKELTEYNDENAIEMAIPAPPDYGGAWKAMGSLPSQNLGTVLQRSYAVGTNTWSSAATQHSNLATFNFPDALFTVPQIAQLLPYYKFFRCKGVRITVRLNSTVQHFGALVLSHVIGQSGVSRVFHDEEIQAYNNDPHVISAMSQDTVSLEIPWRLARAFISLPLDPRFTMTLARVKLTVLFPLSADADSVSNVTVSSFAEFIDAELIGPRPVSFVPLISWEEAEKIQKKIPRKTNQSGKRKNPEAQAKDANGTLDDLRSTFEGFLEVAKVGAEIANIVGILAADKPSTQLGPHNMQPYFGREMMHGAGVDSGVKLSFDPAAQISTDSIEIFDDHLSHNIYDIMRMPGFHLTGTLTNSLGPGDRIAQFPVTPSCPFVQTSGSSEYYMHNYVSHFSLPFSFWRGSMRYMFRFCTSRFTTARIRIVWLPGSDSSVTATIADNAVGDVISRVVDITGDTIVDFTIPYLQTNYYTKIGTGVVTGATSLENGFVGIYLVNEVVNADPDVTPTIYWASWVSAGTDFQVLGYQSVSVPDNHVLQSTDLTPALTSKTNQSCIREMFRETSEPLIDALGFVEAGFVACENYGDVESLVKRYFTGRLSDHVYTNTLSYYPWDTSRTDQVNISGNNLNWISLPFLYMRGSMRYKMVNAENVDYFTIGVGDSSTQFIGGRIMNPTSTSKMMEFELPYFTIYPFLNTDPYNIFLNPSNVYGVRIGYTPTVPTPLYQAVGDDFKYSCLYSPPVIYNGA